MAAVYLALRSSKVNKSAMVKPQRNMVASIYNEDRDIGKFPSSTWYLLTHGNLLRDDDRSARDLILENWNTSTRVFGSKEHLGYKELLLKGEGTYSEDMLQVRIDM